MKILSQPKLGQTTSYNNINRNSVTFSSLLYSPKSVFHRINPVVRYMDDYFQLSLKASRNLWHQPTAAIKPYINEVEIQDKKTPHIKMWDINKDNRKKYLVVMHGLSHNISSLQDLYAEVLNKTEYAVLAPEYHGFGPEDTEFIYMSPKKMLKDSSAALQYLKDKGIREEDICICGHSFGGYAATELAEHNPKLQKLILISSINTDKHWANAIRNGHPIGVPKNIQDMVQKSKIFTWSLGIVFNTAKHLKKVEVPVDIIHSMNDKRVDISTAEFLSKKCQNLNSFNVMKHGSHRMDNEKIQKLISLLNK